MNKEDNVCEETTLTEEFAEAKENGALTVLGKFKDVNALARAYESLQAEFTRRSQRLRELEKEADNFKVGALSSGAEKLRKAAKTKREEQKEFDAFIADMVRPSVEEKKSEEVSMDEKTTQKEGAEMVFFKEKEVKNEESEALVTERSALEQEERAKAPIVDAYVGEAAVLGDKAQGVDDLFERAIKDEAVRLRIIGEYLSSLGKTDAPLTAVGGGTLAAPPMKAKTVGEAGNMALHYFRKPNF